MSKVMLIAVREFFYNLRRPSFLFAVFGTPLILAVALMFSGLAGNTGGGSLDTLRARVVAEAYLCARRLKQTAPGRKERGEGKASRGGPGVAAPQQWPHLAPRSRWRAQHATRPATWVATLPQQRRAPPSHTNAGTRRSGWAALATERYLEAKQAKPFAGR